MSFTLLTSDNQNRNITWHHVAYIFIMSFKNYCSAPINENISMILISLNVPWKSINPLSSFETWRLGHHLYLPNSSYPTEKNLIFLLQFFLQIKMITSIVNITKVKLIHWRNTFCFTIYTPILTVILIQLFLHLLERRYIFLFIIIGRIILQRSRPPTQSTSI